MAKVAVSHLIGGADSFTGADMSTKLKLMGVDVASIGDAHGQTPGSRNYTFVDERAEVYKKRGYSPFVNFNYLFTWHVTHE